MRNPMYYLIALIITCSTTNLFSQDRVVIDSLLQVLETSKKDTNKVLLLTDLAWKFKKLNNDTALIFSEEALKLSKKISFNKGIFDSYFKLGLVHYYNGSHEEAIEFYTKALELAQELKYSKNCIRCYINIGLAYEAQGNLDDAIDNYALGVKVSEEISFEFGIAKCTQSIGIINYNQGFYDKAIPYYKKALEIWTQLDNKSEMSACYILIGRVYKKQNAYNLALEQFFKALELSESSGNKYMMGNCYLAIGRIYMDQGHLKKANENYFKALEINEELNAKNQMAVCFSNIGIIYGKLGSYDHAIKYFQKSVVISEELNNTYLSMFTYDDIGFTYIKQEKYDLAIEYINKSLKIRQNRNDRPGMESNYSNLGLIYSKKRMYKQANAYYLKSLEINKEFNNKRGLASTYQNICSLNIILADSVAANEKQKLAHLYKAIDAGENSIKCAREIESIFEENNAAFVLKSAYLKLGNYKKAMKYADVYITTQDSLFNQEKAKAIQEMETKYETEKKNVEIQALKIKDIENQNIKKTFLLLIIFLFVISIFLVFFFRQKHKSNKMLNEKNYQLNKLNETQSRLMSIISHDLKAPLSAFFSITSSLKSKINTMDSVAIDEYFNRMLNSALSVKLQLENLLVWSINQSIEIKVNKNNLNLSIIAQKVMIILEEFSNQKSITLNNNIDENIDINTDGRLISIVLNNLITNAIKFSDVHSEINILATKKDSKLIISVKDHGCGISKDNLKNLFSEQTKNVNNENIGTGIGLIVCKDIVERLGGKIWAESEIKKGTTFIIEIHE